MLRSLIEIRGYHVQAVDGKIGHVEDFILDDADWKIHYLVVDTRDWLPGRKVLVSAGWIVRIIWSFKNLYFSLTKKQVENSPEYDPSAPVNRVYEQRLYDYYGRPVYWENEAQHE